MFVDPNVSVAWNLIWIEYALILSREIYNVAMLAWRIDYIQFWFVGSGATTPSHGDRFIPLRSATNFELGHYQVILIYLLVSHRKKFTSTWTYDSIHFTLKILCAFFHISTRNFKDNVFFNILSLFYYLDNLILKWWQFLSSLHLKVPWDIFYDWRPKRSMAKNQN